MPETGKKSNSAPPSAINRKALLSQWKVELAGEWTAEEVDRIFQIFRKLSKQSDGRSIQELFNGQTSLIHYSGRPGRVGRTRGADIYLDNEWTNWTLAHELGHRWNNAWGRLPEVDLRKTIDAGALEWLKKKIRRVLRWVEQFLSRLGIQSRLDWRKVWYHPGSAPPPCGVDRNFNASEDLAESFAATLLPEEVKVRAERAAMRIAGVGQNWDWTAHFANFSATPRGQSVLKLLKDLTSQQENSQQSDCPASQDQ
jgi:hypothetical protein